MKDSEKSIKESLDTLFALGLAILLFMAVLLVLILWPSLTKRQSDLPLADQQTLAAGNIAIVEICRKGLSYRVFVANVGKVNPQPVAVVNNYDLLPQGGMQPRLCTQEQQP